MKIENAVAFVTGANRGFGLEVVRQLLARGARKVYAGVRDPNAIDLPGVVAVRLDVTDPASVLAAAKQCGDVDLLINNAGLAKTIGFLAPSSIDAAREMFEVNFFGPVQMSQAFAPVLAANGGGAIINVLSVASWINAPALGPYGASKSAAWGFTNGLRHELRDQGTQVLGLHVGFMDTDMTRDFDVVKIDAASVAQTMLNGLEDGLEEVLADDLTRRVKQGLTSDPGIYLAPMDR